MDQALGKMPNETSPTRRESGWGQEERLEAATGVCIQTTITDGVWHLYVHPPPTSNVNAEPYAMTQVGNGYGQFTEHRMTSYNT